MLELAICDDDIILCNWLEQKLLHYGKANDCQISVEIYYSAEQLLNRLEEESYDMLFLDICLGHENGIDIGTEIRKKNYGEYSDTGRPLVTVEKSTQYAGQVHLTKKLNTVGSPQLI